MPVSLRTHTMTLVGILSIITQVRATQSIFCNRRISSSAFQYLGSVDVLKTLRKKSAPGAAYNSSQREHASGCLPTTREGLLARIRAWIAKKDAGPVFYLTGPAGFGKSAIAQTIAEGCDEEGLLAASFFFTLGDALCNNTATFFFTLAHHLATRLPEVGLLIQAVLKDDPFVLDENLANQFKKLIYKPIVALAKSLSPMIVVVDALDECEDKIGVVKILDIIASEFENDGFPLRFIFTSRPYHHLVSKLRHWASKIRITECGLEQSNAHDDIRAFLRLRLEEIRENRKESVMMGISKPWPPSDQLERLVEKSEGLFIWAATVLKVIDVDGGLPHKLLESALELHAGLDHLYSHILTNAPRSGPFPRVIGSIFFLRQALSIKELATVLGYETEEIFQSLQGLEAILKIPQSDRESIRSYHASLHDFLVDINRSAGFHTDPAECHAALVLDCLRIATGVNRDGHCDAGVISYGCTAWCYHLHLVLMQGGELNTLQSRNGEWILNRMSCLIYEAFDPWFMVLLSQGLHKTRQDIEFTICKLTVSNLPL